MIEDRLNSILQTSGYKRLDSNAHGIYLFYRVEEQDQFVISVIHAVNGNEMTQEQYEHILEQIKTNFRNSYPQRLKLLSLILTGNPGKAKSLATSAQQDSHWILDMSANRLIVYETQAQEFDGFRRMLDQLMADQGSKNDDQTAYQNSNNTGSYQQTGRAPVRTTNRFALTPITATIIAVNLIAYFITHYTSLLGGEYAMLEKGALSWFYIKEDQEYYRLLTSMFMHSDWSHLVNNMIVLLFIGGNLERAAGRYKYLFIYFGSGILAGITSISYNMWKEYENVSFFDTTISIGASGAIFGIVGAILYIVLINKGRIAEISTRQMIVFVVLSLYSGFANSQIDQAAHVGGFIAGLILSVLVYRKHSSANKR